MLVLTMRVGDVTHIGNEIKVRVLSMSNGQVRVGFDAPKNVNILRGKVKDKLEAEGVPVVMEKGHGTKA